MLIIIIRTVLLFILVVFSLRLMGKKQLGELQPSELVTTILISNIATLSIEDPSIPMLTGIIPILMIVCTDVLMSGIMLKYTPFRRLVTGSPKVIISNGKINRKELKILRYTIDDVLESMRDADIFDINEVQYAIVETTGKINFFKKSDGTADPPTVIIKDGSVVRDGLKQAGLGAEWLENTLKKRRLSEKEIFLLTAKGDGTYTVILKDNENERKSV